MAVRMMDLIMGAGLPELRMHPTSKWVRALVGNTVVVDSRAASVVWEPRRVVPSYAVPRQDVDAELSTATPREGIERPVRIGRDGREVLDPSTPFASHSCPGTPLTIHAGGRELVGAAFAPDDPDLAGHVVLDWNAFTEWREEDEPVLGHPHDPFDRIDCLRSTRRVRISLDGQVLADSGRPVLLFETPLPTRYYLPRADVRMDLLERTDLQTVCAYKGRASYWSARLRHGLLPNVAWTYEEPLHDATPVRDLVCFFTERLDLAVDGVAVERPVTPWS